MNTTKINSLFLFLSLLVGLIGSLFFLIEIYFPLLFSLVIISFVMFYMFYLIQIKIIGIVTLFFYIVVILPSLHLYPYIIYDFNTENPKNMWGMYANIYMKDEKIITILAMATAISSLGMLLGSLVDNSKLKFNNFLQDKNNMSSLPLMIWVFWVFLGILITSLTSYQDTLLSATYTQSTTNLQDYNVSAAWFIAFSIAIFAYCDQIYDQNIIRKKIKKKLIIFTLFLIIFYFGLFRGDRECLTLLIGVIIFEFIIIKNLEKREQINIPWFKFFFYFIIVAIIGKLVGILRYLDILEINNLDTLIFLIINSYDIAGGLEFLSFQNLISGTWSFSMLSSLSVIGDYVEGTSKRLDLFGNTEILWGRDYLDLFLSIPPGAIADLMGYQRPWNTEYSPAWDMSYGQGGTHLYVLPFRNFLMFGVFFIPSIFVFLLKKLEKFSLLKRNFKLNSLLLIVLVAIPHWAWYGEKAIVNAIIIWYLLLFFYRISLNIPKFLKNI